MNFIRKFIYNFKKTRLTYSLVLFLFTFACITGCSNDNDDSDNDSTVSERSVEDEKKDSQDNPVQDNPVQDNNEKKEDEEPENDYNPLELQNYFYYKDDSKTNEFKDVSVIALVGNNYKNDEQVSAAYLLGIKDNVAVFEYGVSSYRLKSEEEQKEAQSEYDSKYEYNYSEHLLVVNTDDMSVIKDIETGSDSLMYAYDNYIYFSNRDYDNNKSVITVYDYNIKELYSHEFDGYTSVYFDRDLKCGYFVEEGKLKCISTKDDTVSVVSTEDYFEFNYVLNLFEAPDGDYYVLASGMAANTKNYNIIIDASNGRTVKVFDDNAPFVRSDTDNKMILTAYDDPVKVTYAYLDNCSEGVSYKVNNDNDINDFFVLPDGKVLISKYDKNFIELYEYDKDKLLASTKVAFDASLTGDYSKFSDDVPQIFKDASEEMGMEGYDGIYNACITGTPVITEDGNIIFCVSANNLNYYLKWTPDKDYNGVNIAETSDYSLDSIDNPDLEAKVDSSKYVPGELSDNLKVLRQKADNIEKKYGIEIVIGEECRNIFGGYAMDALTDYSTVETALKALESQLERYPEGFFKQFANEYNNGLKIYLTSTITGVDDYNLSQAGGFQNTIDDYRVIVIDARYEMDVIQTFNHELSHAIEGVIWDKCLFENDYCLSDEHWEKYNPQIGNTVYTYDYSIFGYEEYYKYAFENEYQLNDDTYFVDEYSMTWPTEDRARIFEEVMTGRYGIDLDNAGHLKDKLNYYCKCIRKGFDTTGWNNVPWEQYYTN